MKRSGLAMLALAMVLATAFVSCELITLPGAGAGNSGGGSSINVPGNSFAEKMGWLRANALSSGSNYIVEISADEQTNRIDLDSPDSNNITITLRGSGANRTISLSSIDGMFTVRSGITLVLDNNITLLGNSENQMPVITVNYGGTLVMNTGSAITGNSSTSNSGVAVGGTFIMNGGMISGNAGRWGGGGVHVNINGTFTMNGGTIAGNTGIQGGGGVRVNGAGTFNMNGGAIFGNTSEYGGGVYTRGVFVMSGGTISGNTATEYGGGVCVIYGGAFTKFGDAIIIGRDATNGNTAAKNNGGHAISVGVLGPNEKNVTVYTSAGRKETTAGSGADLSVSINNSGYLIFSGEWDR